MQSGIDDIRLVILSRLQRLSGDVVLTLVNWRLVNLMVSPARLGMHEPPRQSRYVEAIPLENRLLINIEKDGLINLGAALCQHGIKGLSLLDGSWEPVENNPVLALGPTWISLLLIKILLDVVYHDLVRHKLAGHHNVFEFLPEEGAGLSFSSEHVTSRDVAQAESLGQLEGMRPLAYWEC